ncbi:hypothetical protein RchiOBHm_Chr2g0176171 [Rosa chinensis]|uniref:Uncharacterized protein n=1 Tax=Rosa chinensis TaxID=74649 RepID=A0A2P6S6P2_ROSCH|nr:hypothetical protein RchiOBHm_Chr2g0176171 [Rosa chinensis]
MERQSRRPRGWSFRLRASRPRRSRCTRRSFMLLVLQEESTAVSYSHGCTYLDLVKCNMQVHFSPDLSLICFKFYQ